MKILPQTITLTIIGITAVSFAAASIDSFPFYRSIIAATTIAAIMYYYNAQNSTKKNSTKKIETATGKTATALFGIFTIVFFIDLYSKKPNILLSGIGLTIMIIGAFLYSKAALFLGKFFSTNAEIKKGHALKTNGLFGIIRHPAYASSMLFYVGMALAANSLACLAIFTICFLPWYYYRIKTEEKMLEKEFGKEFLDYKSRVPALLPNPKAFLTKKQ